MAHPDVVPPQQAHLPASPPPHVHQGSFESDPSEPMDLSTASSEAPDDDDAPTDSGIVNEFLSSESV